MSSESYSAAEVRRARERLLEAGIVSSRAERIPAAVSPLIERSWRRSVFEGVGGTAPASASPRFLASEPSVEAPLNRAASAVLERWGDALADMKAALFVSDRSGRIISRRVGDAAHARSLDRADAAEGFDFSESALGTNGLGTVLEERSAVLVRGAEHFDDSLQSLACAGAPIRDPLSKRVIGSVALAVPVDASNSMMMTVAKRAADDFRTVMLEVLPDELRLLLARFVRGEVDRPAIAVGRAGVLANTGVLPWLSVERQISLWDELQAHEWSRGECSVLIAGRQGSARRILNHSGEGVYLVELEEAPRGVAEAPGASELLLRLDAVAHGSGCLALSGSECAGGRDLGREWLRHRTGEEPLVFEAGADGPAELLARSHRALASGCSVLVTGLEALGAEQHEPLSALIRSVHPAGTARLVLCLSEEVDSGLRWLVAEEVPVWGMPSLGDDPDRVVLIAQRFARENGVVLSPALLQALARWDWPGGKDELWGLLTAAAAAHPRSFLDVDALPDEIRSRARRLYGIAASEYRAIRAALQEAGGNRSRAAESLGIGRTTLYRKLRAYGLDGDSALSA